MKNKREIWWEKDKKRYRDIIKRKEWKEKWKEKKEGRHSKSFLLNVASQVENKGRSFDVSFVSKPSQQNNTSLSLSLSLSLFSLTLAWTREI